MNHTIYLNYTVAQTLYAFPQGQSLTDWATYRVAMTEGTGDDTGRYTATVDDANGDIWLIFLGATQPSDWTEAITEPIDVDAKWLANITIGGSVNDGSPAATSFIGDSGLSATDDFYNGCALVFTSGALTGLTRRVSDYAGSTKTFTFATAFPTAPANSDTFKILGRIE